MDPDPYPSGIYSILSYPTIRPPAPVPEEVAARVGDIELTQTMVRTPVGAAPLGAVTWQVEDEYIVRTPTWAVVATIATFFVAPLLNLLFLLARETVATGAGVVTVTAGDLRHETRVTDPEEAELARSLAAGNPSTVD
jgi:hypothetical protein